LKECRLGLRERRDGLAAGTPCGPSGPATS
jgi:hypothetical protein